MFDITVSKDSVSQISPTEFLVSIQVLITENGETILEKPYSKRYTTGDTMAGVKAVLLAQIRADWIRLQAERALMNEAAFDTLCSQIQTTINTQIN